MIYFAPPKNSKYLAIAGAITIFLSGLACGTLVSNPKKPGTTGTGGEIKFPSFSTNIASQILDEPESLTLTHSGSLSLMGLVNPKYTTLHKWLQGSHKIIVELNTFFTNLSEENLNKIGKFLATEKDAALSGILKDLSGMDTTYTYQISLCYNNKKFLDFKWNSQETAFYLDRNLNAKSLDGNSIVARSLMTGSLDDAGSLLLEVKNGGSVTSLVVESSDQEQETTTAAAYESYTAKIYTDKSVEIRGVADWNNVFPKQEEKVTLSADYYMTGKVEQEKSWQFVTFNGVLAKCNAYNFDENSTDLWQDSLAPDYKGWCYGRSSESPLPAYHGSLLNTYFEGLESIGIARQSDIVDLNPEDVSTCDE